MLCKASLLQPVAKFLDGVHKVAGVLALLEGRGIHKVAVEGAHLAGQGLHQHPNGHAGWEGVRVDDQIRPAASYTQSINIYGMSWGPTVGQQTLPTSGHRM